MALRDRALIHFGLFFFLQSFAKQHRPRLIFHVFVFGIELCLKNNNSMVFSLDNHGHIKKNEII